MASCNSMYHPPPSSRPHPSACMFSSRLPTSPINDASEWESGESGSIASAALRTCCSRLASRNSLLSWFAFISFFPSLLAHYWKLLLHPCAGSDCTAAIISSPSASSSFLDLRVSSFTLGTFDALPFSNPS